MFLDKLIAKLPKVKAQEEEEEWQDPHQILREKCREEEKALKLQEKYEACNDRVNSRSKTAEICSEELFDWLHVVEHCVAKDLFSKLK